MLSEECNIPINPDILGMWELIIPSEENNGDKFNLSIFKFNEYEYLIVLRNENEDDLLFRAYEVDVDGIKVVQVQMRLDGMYFSEAASNKIYTIAFYKLNNDILELFIIESKQIKINNCEELKKHILKNKNNLQFFPEFGKYRKTT